MSAENLPKPPKKLFGVGGWLILPIIGFAGTILLTGINLAVALQSFDGLVLIFTDTTGQFSAMRVPVALSLLFGVAVMTSAAICLYRIFIAKSHVKGVAVIHYCILATAGIIELWGDGVISANLPNTAEDPSVVKDAVRNVVVAMIWIPYFLISKRVANTFKTATASNSSSTTQSN
jgi:Protein of unknown function (DUF2569)